MKSIENYIAEYKNIQQPDQQKKKKVKTISYNLTPQVVKFWVFISKH
jgi:hypothetical protein